VKRNAQAELTPRAKVDRATRILGPLARSPARREADIWKLVALFNHAAFSTCPLWDRKP